VSTVDLYAVLGVARDSSRDEIRTAWSAAIAGLDPTAPTFRVFNQAGEVLLDDTRREKYDADLAASEAAQAEAPAATEGASAASEGASAEASGAVSSPPLPEAAPAGRRTPTAPTWLLAALLVLTLLVGGAAAFASDRIGAALPDKAAPKGAQNIADAVTAAEKAVVPVLAYDYRDLDGTKKAAVAQLTPKFREKYEQTFTLIQQNAPETKAVVSVQVVASAVGRVSDASTEVLLFVNRPTTNKAHPEPVIYKDQVTLTMVRSGSTWRIDNMRTTPPA
jgi:Mce-associated membrane protein